MRERLLAAGYNIASKTDSELIAHLVHLHLGTGNSLKEAVCQSIAAIAGDEECVSRGNYHHLMAKEIHEQGTAIQQTLSNRLGESVLLEGIPGDAINAVIKKVQAVEIVACGTSYHSGETADTLADDDYFVWKASWAE